MKIIIKKLKLLIIKKSKIKIIKYLKLQIIKQILKIVKKYKLVIIFFILELIEDVSKKPFVNPDSPDILVNHWRKKNLRLCRSSNVSGELNDDHIQTRTKSKT